MKISVADLEMDDPQNGIKTYLKEEIEWVPLQNHPIFVTNTNSISPSDDPKTPRNLVAWDGSSHLYLWNSHKLCLHRLSVRFGDHSIDAASSSKMLLPDTQMDFVVHNISINRTGSLLFLAGSGGLCVMCLYKRTSTIDNIAICRTVSVGSRIYFDKNILIRTLQVSWHPYSDRHLGILSSDSVFRLFDLSSDLERPEQEYYLQPFQPGRCHNAVSVRPVAFSFGGEHLWDKFTVFVVFSDGLVYVLCPVVPFGSVFSWASIEEIYKDANTFGLKSSNLRAVSNSSLAIAWLEATFPEVADQPMEGGNVLGLKAHPYAPFDASLTLQGPLCNVRHSEKDDDSKVQSAECEGKALNFLYNLISKDSILVTAWSSGQLQIDALADELQPVWNVGSAPRLWVDSHGHLEGVAMICESNSEEISGVKLGQRLDQEVHPVDTVWLGHPPPLLRLAVVDLALPTNAVNCCLLSIFSDPLVPERIYCLHGGGVDLITLHFLPFSDQNISKDETTKVPSVNPILSTCHNETCSSSPLCGFVALADSFGYSWIVGITSSRECVVLAMEGWNTIPPLQVDLNENFVGLAELSEKVTPEILSQELLSGPKAVLIPQASSTLRSLTADSIEGRSTLHHYFKLFHENYVEYAHKVYVELKHHGSHLKRIIDSQHTRLSEANKVLLNVEEKQQILDQRIDHAMQVNGHLEERLQSFRSFPGANKKPLSRAERKFKSEIERFTGFELDALRSSIETLNARLRKYTQSSQGNSNSPRQTPGRRKNHVPDAQISHLKASIEKLSLVNTENTKKVKLVECALTNQESNE